jgi:hypothetical protein
MPRRLFASTFHPSMDSLFCHIARLMKVISISDESRIIVVLKSREMKDLELPASHREAKEVWTILGSIWTIRDISSKHREGRLTLSVHEQRLSHFGTIRADRGLISIRSTVLWDGIPHRGVLFTGRLMRKGAYISAQMRRIESSFTWSDDPMVLCEWFQDI